MEKWIRNQCDIYNNYKSYSFSLPLTMKNLLRNCEIESENIINSIRDNSNSKMKTRIKKNCVSESRENIHIVDENGNTVKNDKFTKKNVPENLIWRRLSLQSYKKKKQERQEQKTKPLLPPVLRTYDKRGLQNTTINWL